MKFLYEQIKEEIHNLIKSEFDLDVQDINFSIPANRKFGDLSTTLPFVIAKKEGLKPFEVGRKMLERIAGKFNYFSDVKLAGGGFLNFYFKKEYLFNYLVTAIGRRVPANNKKVIVEHTSINPNKAAHIGHLRNSCLGDTLAHAFRDLGFDVEVQNYIDDTGIQMADVVWGLVQYRKMDLTTIKQIGNLAAYLWDLYAEVHRILEESPELIEERNKVHKNIEEKIDPEFEVCRYVADEVLKDHIRVMDSLGIQYDLLVNESDIIELDFFNEAKQILLDNGTMYLSKDPKKEGCLVIRYDKENIEKIIIRSNKTITYIGKDIAYTMWKIGRFPRDFYYFPFFSYRTGKQIFMTQAAPVSGSFQFGNANQVYNVIGVRQAYLQNIIAQVLKSLPHMDGDRFFSHFAYEMVALTPNCVKELGLPLSQADQNKSYVEVSGRKGIAVKADELVTKLTEKSLVEVEKRNRDLSDEEANKVARAIAIGAIRYFMIKFNSTSVIAFDFEDALAFEGDTGPYLQYTVVRLNSILRKMADYKPEISEEGVDFSLFSEKESDLFYEMLLTASQTEVNLELALKNQEISGIANHTYNLCQKFNHYYHLFPIISEKNQKLKDLRIQLLWVVKDKLEKLLGIMGIPIPTRM